MRIFFDIETLPRPVTEAEKELMATIQAGMGADGKNANAKQRLEREAQEAALQLKELAGVGGVVKDPAKILESAKEKIDKTGADPNKLQVCCIGWAIDDQPAQSLIMPENNEAELLKAFQDRLPPPVELGGAVWIGHNVFGFDFPAIWRRAVKYGLPVLRRHVPHEKFSRDAVDTMQLWGGTDYRDMTGLKTIAEFLGIKREAEINGGDVAKLWAAGKYDLVAAYCADDVELVRKVFIELNGY